MKCKKEKKEKKLETFYCPEIHKHHACRALIELLINSYDFGLESKSYG